MKILSIIIAMLVVVSSYSQLGNLGVAHYKKEKIEYFEFLPFERSFTGLDASMDSLEKKPGKDWKFQDSLQFIINVAKLGNHSRAYNELKKFHLHDVSNDAATHIAMIYSLNKRYDLAKRWLEYYKPNNKNEILAKKIWLDILVLRQDILDYKKVLKYEDVFDIDDQTSYTDLEKKSEKFREEVIYPLEAGELILRLHIQYEDSNDPVMAKLASEMGDVIHQHLSLTMTYVAFSLASHYDNNFKNSKKLKLIKKEIGEKNYEIIPLKNFFPKEKKSRFSYKYIKEKKIQEQEQANKHEIPAFESDKEESIFDSKGFYITIGLILVLLFVIFFVKTNKK